MIFFLGTHRPNWLWAAEDAIPFFVSRRRLAPYRTLRPAREIWALDSGGFSELTLYGEWRTSPRQYVGEVRRFADEIGGLQFAAIQDWMCEPHLLKKTGKTVEEHQALTIVSALELRLRAPDLPWLPVLQGWEMDDYLRHIDLYAAAGLDLSTEPVVGIGSVCRRQATNEIAEIVRAVSARGIRLHGFGVKTGGLAKIGHLLGSSDSMAWSLAARYQPPLPGCSGHKNCANCYLFARQWYHEVTGRNPE